MQESSLLKVVCTFKAIGSCLLEISKTILSIKLMKYNILHTFYIKKKYNQTKY